MRLDAQVSIQWDGSISLKHSYACTSDISSVFWEQWQQYRDYLYRCCVKWMGNPTDAEDALSQSMLKAWEKTQKSGYKIANFKAWLIRLTYNHCIDIHREHSRSANRVEDIEGYASYEEQGLVQNEVTPYCVMETGEEKIVIRRAIDNLPTRLRETFILHFYQELSYPEIAQQQEISYQNVCKRISQARKILQEELKGYFIDEEGTVMDKSVPPTAMESAIGEMFQRNAGVEATVGDTVTLSKAVEEVESVGGEEAIKVVRDVQQSDSTMVAATSEGRLEVRSDGCRCVNRRWVKGSVHRFWRWHNLRKKLDVGGISIRRRRGGLNSMTRRNGREILLQFHTYCFSRLSNSQSQVKSLWGMEMRESFF